MFSREANRGQIDAIIGVGFLTKMIVSGVGQHIYCLPTANVSDAVQFVGASFLFYTFGIPRNILRELSQKDTSWNSSLGRYWKC